MKERSGGKLVDEKYLFHGTDESLIEAICEQNFDWRMCGVHGTAYGKGIERKPQNFSNIINIFYIAATNKSIFICKITVLCFGMLAIN